MIAPLDRVVIVMMSAVGDAVHVRPVINAIKRARPQSHISWILQPGPATLVRGHESVDEILLFDRSRGMRAYVDLRNALASRRFDVALALQVYFKAGLVLAMTRARVKLGFDRARARDLNWLFTSQRVPPHPMQHVQDQYLEFLRPLGIDPEPVEWKLGPWPEEREWQREFFAPIERPAVSIVVATSKPEKDWMPDPEIAFAGRSNVGKSTLINKLVQRKKLARVSNTPGRTREIHFFRVNQDFVLVDLPGYGYARIAKERRAEWKPLIEGFLKDSAGLRGIVLLLDVRRDPSSDDEYMLDFLAELGLPVIVAVTKVDKLPRAQIAQRVGAIAKALGLDEEQVIPFSAVSGSGRKELADAVMSLLAQPSWRSS
jgi:ribosome biogenesis GTP-binding protein YsxC/EngB